MIPTRLWCTVISHSWSATGGRRASTSFGCLSATSTVDMPLLARSLQGHQVAHNSGDLVIGQVHGRHEDARLEMRRVPDPAPQVLLGVGGDPCPDGRTAHEMGQVWSECPVGGGAPDSVATHAGGTQENGPPGRHLGRFRGPGLLRGYPPIELGLGMHEDTDLHVGVLGAAVLRTLAVVRARPD